MEGIKEIIALALKEDIGHGDITSESIFEKNHTSNAVIKAKQDCIVCGEIVLREIKNFFKNIDFTVFKKDGESAKNGDIIYSLQGNTIELLKLERTLLNFVQRLSGIATTTNKFVEELKGTNIKLLDTRKTTPGMRYLEKYAVKTGGGFNHRYGLFDGILIKENHIKAAGSIEKAVQMCRKNNHHLIKIEVEVEDLTQLEEALKVGADGVLLDNMNNKDIEKACTYKNDYNFFIEVSGGITIERIKELKYFDIDYISSGYITHSAGIVDLTMLII
ncbi:nicotinate-nucleotide pyrophosphorylase (carboxylating) [Thermotomaculum hydrothermale]|uniref:Probable nicotinate-nucleotide pyrophosphorylase [carboxylating] n=1 Tax=Thermotomaculum hydrothermale TaxID=981385 RepID=A0A7R6T0B5_9BACT|nr:carboxylating nicotinate-nucleotide diphosphorylase [Thermotomaculum hydrothermale]BBB33542.1 nicotinate-nucleotide pyrophosphorylase (carboxylating) [Thermotomaculum hydrothermale]